MSSAYYAVFHALAAMCTGALLQRTADEDSKLRVYRALDHGPMKNAFSQAPLKDHARFKEIGALVRQLQDERHRADYLPPDNSLFPINEAREIIGKARFVVGSLRELDQESRLILATCLLFKERKS
ncbi:hypothetical protein [Martelella sp. AMO21009]